VGQPAELSVLDGVNPLGARALMPVFNNLAMFDQHAKQSRLEAIISDLATSWTWNEDDPHLSAAPGRQMARRQSVHRQ
jgi:hypothetical protein